MKGRESGMPEEDYWQSFFDADGVVETLFDAAGVAGDLVEFGCGYGTFTLPAARCTRGVVTALDIEPLMVARVRQKAEAQALATRMLSDPEKALDTLAREELGLNPDELGSPWGAASSSFLAFSAGAFIPLLPFLLSAGSPALLSSIGITALALFAVGATISLFTGRSAIRDGLRMLGIGAIAGALTYGIGNLLGVSLG